MAIVLLVVNNPRRERYHPLLSAPSRPETRLSRHRDFLRSLGYYLASFALAVQLVAPAASASGPPGLGIAGLICAPSGTPSAASLAKAEAMLAQLLGEPVEEERSQHHCALCIPVSGVPSSEHRVIVPAAFEGRAVKPRRSETVFVRRAQGPPLGLRAPPFISL